MIEDPIKVAIILDQELPVLGFVSHSNMGWRILLLLSLALCLFQHACNDAAFKMREYSFEVRGLLRALIRLHGHVDETRINMLLWIVGVIFETLLIDEVYLPRFQERLLGCQ